MCSRRWLQGIMIALLVSAPAVVHAQCAVTSTNGTQNCIVNVTASVAVPQLLQLTSSQGTTTLTPPTLADYDTSANPATTASNLPYGGPGPTLTVKSNRPWQLYIGTPATGWSFTQDPALQIPRTAPEKSVSDLYWSTNQTAGFVALTNCGPGTGNANAALTGNAAGINGACTLLGQNGTGSTATYGLYYRVKWLYASDVPGTYDLTVQFTLVGN